MADSIADELISRQGKLKSYRSNFEAQWAIIARYVLPRANDFNTKTSPGAKKGEQFIFDSTAQLALPSFAAAVESMTIPRTQKWHGLMPVDPSLRRNETIRAWCEAKRDLLFAIRYAPMSGFTGNASEVNISQGAFGTSGFFVEDALAKGIRYRSFPLSQLYLAEDQYNLVDTVFRCYPLTARQAVKRWPTGLPEAITKAAEKEPDREFEFLHVVIPNEERKGGDPTYRGMAMAAYDICLEGRKLLHEGGYRTMPYMCPRYTKSPGEVYGRSPAWDAMADIQTVNEQSRTSLRWGQLSADPPWVTADVDSASPFTTRPGSVNAGYMTEQGQVLAQSLAPNGDPRIGLELMDQRRTAINRSFLITLFQILVETPEMTATEAIFRAQEKGALLAPTVGRQQEEFMGPMIRRELDIAAAAGLLDDMPDELRTRGGVNALAIQYDNPVLRMMNAEQTSGVLQTLQAITPLAQIDQGILRDINPRRTLRYIRDGFGAPADMLNTDEEMAALAEQEQAQTAAQDLITAAPVVGQTVKDLASAAKDANAAAF